MKKKTRIIVLNILGMLIILLGTTYAHWLITRTQNGVNTIASTCLDISLSDEQNDIHLTNQFPMSDTDGMQSTPYTFTITNNCNNSIDYYVSLESIEESDDLVSANSIKVVLDENKPLTLAEKLQVDVTIEEAYDSRVLEVGTLAPANDSNGGNKKSYELRLWIDENASLDDMNKTYLGRISVTAGQGINYYLTEGTLAYDIVSKYGGNGSVSTLNSDWSEGEYGEETYTSFTKTRSYYWGTELVFDESNGTYKLGGEIVQAKLSDCRPNATTGVATAECGKYTLKNATNASATAQTAYVITNFTSSSKTDAFTLLYADVKEVAGVNNFSKTSEVNSANLHKAKDDLGDSYYFRGDATNNYVKFGVYQEDLKEVRGYYSTTSKSSYKIYETLNECTTAISYNENCEEVTLASLGETMYWRIIRINGDGTIRMIYDGTSAYENGVSHASDIGSRQYNATTTDMKSVGYTYEEDEKIDSLIKDLVDDWYETNLLKNYESYIADALYCNDQSVVTISSTNYYYGAYERLQTYKNPSLLCSKEYRYSKKIISGNKKLSNPVSLITADEVAYAGGVSSKQNSNYYLYNGSNYWLNSPSYYVNNSASYMWYVDSSGSLNYNEVTNYLGVRPVINLKADVAFTGLGTIDKPYEIGV